MNMDTKKAVWLFVAAIVSTLKDEPVPSGTLYAFLMGKGVSFNQYGALISSLKSEGLIVERNFLLSLTARGHELADSVNKRLGMATVQPSVSAG